MLQETEIVELIAKARKYELPQWQRNYMTRIAKDLQVHTKGLLFSKVDTLFPHEHPDSKNHCVNTYEPITKGSIWKAIKNLIRIFSNSSFTVSASDSTLDFVNKANYNGQNLFSYFIEHWNTHAIATDPNALCAVYPPDYLEENPGDIIRFIKNEHIRRIDKNHVVFISEAESEKEYEVVDTVVKREVFIDPKISGPNFKNVIEKTYNQQVTCKILTEVIHVFSKEYILRFYKNKEEKIVWSIYYFLQPQRSIAAFPLSGVPLQPDVNESFVAPFIPFGNLALLQHRNHRAVDLMFSYPRMSEIETPCDNLNCQDGYVPQLEDPSKTTTCSRCKGNGYITAQSPYKVYKKKIDTGLSDPELVKNLLASNPVDFHTPDTSILTYSKDSWKEYLSMAEEAVFIQQKQQTGNTESAKAKEIDKEGEYSWILNISKAFNTDLKKVIQCHENFLVNNPEEVSLEQPISFAIVTETEAFQALDAIISSEAPIFIKAQQVENFVHKFVSKSSPVVKALTILKQIDPLLFYSNKDVQSFKSNNVVSIDAWTVHVYAYSVLMNLYQRDKKLFDKTEDKIIGEISAEIEKIKPAATGNLKDNLLKKAVA
ncbi:MAG: hypothetical protein WKF88_09350 [Ferruginibacter sp.]